MGGHLPALSPNDHPNPSQGRHKGPGKNCIVGFTSSKNAESSYVLAGKGPRGPTRGTGSSDPRPVPLVRGYIYHNKKSIAFGKSTSHRIYLVESILISSGKHRSIARKNPLHSLYRHGEWWQYRKKVSEPLIFELPRAKNYLSRLCPTPLENTPRIHRQRIRVTNTSMMPKI